MPLSAIRGCEHMWEDFSMPCGIAYSVREGQARVPIYTVIPVFRYLVASLGVHFGLAMHTSYRKHKPTHPHHCRPARPNSKTALAPLKAIAKNPPLLY